MFSHFMDEEAPGARTGERASQPSAHSASAWGFAPSSLAPMGTLPGCRTGRCGPSDLEGLLASLWVCDPALVHPALDRALFLQGPGPALTSGSQAQEEAEPGLSCRSVKARHRIQAAFRRLDQGDVQEGHGPPGEGQASPRGGVLRPTLAGAVGWRGS